MLRPNWPWAPLDLFCLPAGAKQCHGKTDSSSERSMSAPSSISPCVTACWGERHWPCLEQGAACVTCMVSWLLTYNTKILQKHQREENRRILGISFWVTVKTCTFLRGKWLPELCPKKDLLKGQPTLNVFFGLLVSSCVGLLFPLMPCSSSTGHQGNLGYTLPGDWTFLNVNEPRCHSKRILN